MSPRPEYNLMVAALTSSDSVFQGLKVSLSSTKKTLIKFLLGCYLSE